MEKVADLAKGGVLRLLPGFRFHPTDEELVMQYLERKVLRRPLPAAIIPEIQLPVCDPRDLPGSAAGERYFFSPAVARRPRGRAAAAAGGYWKAVGRQQRVVAPGSSQVVGMKRTLVFCKGKAPEVSRTGWVMQEYRLAGGGCAAGPCVLPQRQRTSVQVEEDDWVLCRVFEKRRLAGDGRSAARRGHHHRSSPATPPDSEMSGVTEASDQECGSEGQSGASSSPPGEEP